MGPGDEQIGRGTGTAAQAVLCGAEGVERKRGMSSEVLWLRAGALGAGLIQGTPFTPETRTTRLRSKLSGRQIEADIYPNLCHENYGYPVLVGHAGEDSFLIPWLDAQLYPVTQATEEERQRLTDAGYALDQAEA